MSFISTAMSLEFWARFLVRVEKKIQSHAELAAELRLPREATVDNYELEIEKANLDRDKFFDILRDVENLQMLHLTLGDQISDAQIAYNIPAKIRNRVNISALLNLFEINFMDLPNRADAERKLAYSHKKMEILKSGGQGEVVTAERQRHRAVSDNILMLGREDVVAQVNTAHRLRTLLDELDSELMGLRANVIFPLRIEQSLVLAAAGFGLKLEEEPAQEIKVQEAPITDAEHVE